MSNLTIPEQFIKSVLTIVAVRTQLILDLKPLNDDQKKQAIDEMIERQMASVRAYGSVD